MTCLLTFCFYAYLMNMCLIDGRYSRQKSGSASSKNKGTFKIIFIHKYFFCIFLWKGGGEPKRARKKESIHQ